MVAFLNRLFTHTKNNMNKQYEAYLNSNDKTKEIEGCLYYKAVCVEHVRILGKKAVKIVLPVETFGNDSANKIIDEKNNTYTLTDPTRMSFTDVDFEWYGKIETYYAFEDKNENLDAIGIFFRAVDPDWRWALVGNIVESHEYGENHEIRYGTKHFPPGAKVYIAPTQWGDGWEKVIVIGVPRKSKKYIEIVMPSKYIENYRVQKVLKPAVLKKMNGSKYRWWNDSDQDKKTITGFIKSSE